MGFKVWEGGDCKHYIVMFVCVGNLNVLLMCFTGVTAREKGRQPRAKQQARNIIWSIYFYILPLELLNTHRTSAVVVQTNQKTVWGYTVMQRGAKPGANDALSSPDAKAIYNVILWSPSTCFSKRKWQRKHQRNNRRQMGNKVSLLYLSLFFFKDYLSLVLFLIFCVGGLVIFLFGL